MENKPKIRLYVDAPLAADSEISLSEPQSHYLVHVMRQKTGQQLLLFNGSDGEWLVEISDAHKKHTRLLLRKKLREQSASPDVWLLFAPVKNKNEIIIEKAVELGASKIIPVITRYTVVRSINEERMCSRIIEAAEQCGRLDIPQLAPASELKDILGSWQKDRCLLFADERGSGAEIRSLFAKSLPAQNAVIIGPEGGFSEDEQRLLQSQLFVKSFSLGPRILRADTAAIASLSCLMALVGDWDNPACHPALLAGSGAL